MSVHMEETLPFRTIRKGNSVGLWVLLGFFLRASSNSFLSRFSRSHGRAENGDSRLIDLRGRAPEERCHCGLSSAPASMTSRFFEPGELCRSLNSDVRVARHASERTTGGRWVTRERKHKTLDKKMARGNCAAVAGLSLRNGAVGGGRGPPDGRTAKALPIDSAGHFVTQLTITESGLMQSDDPSRGARPRGRSSRGPPETPHLSRVAPHVALSRPDWVQHTRNNSKQQDGKPHE
jgi:hypothetical protein